MMEEAMRYRCMLLILSLAIVSPSLARGDMDLLDQIKTGRLPESALQEHVASLDEAAMLKLANDAFQKGWDGYAVSQAILRPYYESKELMFTMEKKLAIIRDPKMHPNFRADVAVNWGIRGRDSSLDFDVFLMYADESLALYEDETIEHWYKQGIPDSLREALQRRAGDIKKEPGDEGGKVQALAKLDARGIRVMSDLTTYLEKNPRPSKNRAEYSASSFAAASLSNYVNWYLSEGGLPNEATQKRLDAVRKAQTEFVAILNDPTYDPTAARAVLRFAKESGLHEVLSMDTISEIKKDNRFSSEDDQRLLDALQKEVEKGVGKGGKGSRNIKRKGSVL